MVFHRLWSSVGGWWFLIASCRSFVLGVAAHASPVSLPVIIDLLFPHWARQFNFQEASTFFHFQLCLWNGSERLLGRCTYIDKRHAERLESESRVLFLSPLRQKVYFSRPGARSSSVRFFPVVVLEVLFGQSLVSLGCRRSQSTKFNFVVIRGGLESVLFLVGPLQTGCWVQLMTENWNVNFWSRSHKIWRKMILEEINWNKIWKMQLK